MAPRSVAIAGAGMAGLSLACALIERGFRGDVRLIDERTEPDAMRTWCWWDVPGIRFRSHASYIWPAWRIVDHTGEIVRRSEQHPYLYLAGEDFFAAARRMLRDANVRYERGERVESFSETADGAVLTCASGRQFEADVAIDARGSRCAPETRVVRQRFVGQFVRVADPVFRTDAVTLMDFRTARTGVAHFTYVLPFAADRALIEDTLFTFNDQSRAVQRAAIGAYVEDVLGTAIVDIEREESGALPLDTARPPQPTRRIGYAGTAAGAVRASSGYAFARTQRHVSAVAQAIVAGTSLPALRAERYRRLDATLLALLGTGAVQAPWFFRTLFAQSESAALARFLSDASTAADDARMIAGMLARPA